MVLNFQATAKYLIDYFVGGAAVLPVVVLLLAGALLFPWLAAGEAVVPSAGTTVAAGEGCCGCGVGVAAGVDSSGADCNTERGPKIGSDNVKASSIKSDAAPIVIFASREAVPRGPNAVLETLLEKRSPAPALPGCKSTATTSTMHVKIKRPYKT
jgi:hypothetical protein